MVDFAGLVRQVASVRAAGASRSSLANPAEGILDLFRRHERVAVAGVRCLGETELQVVYGYLMEPAWRWGCTLLICADRELSALADPAAGAGFTPPAWRYPWTLERLLDLAGRAREPQPVAIAVPVNRRGRWWGRLSRRRDAGPTSPTAVRLDPEQMAAVHAGDGVVQVIAPAGSGKTTVLVERVRELQRRGSPPERILCLSFNRDAKREIAQRLERAGLTGVVVRSFHGLGLELLRTEGHLRSGIGGLGDGELAELIDTVPVAGAGGDGGTLPRLEVADAREAISSYKLALMISPCAAQELAADSGPRAQAAALVYALHEQELVRRDRLDFDDLVARSVTLLQSDPDLRRRWQARFERVLVDEYQDIEPVQALLVGILAAPQDSLFCVGDEDQCIYAWRRATVQRIIELDQVYPGLERRALVRNYRCGRRITTASRRLIEHNRIRFRKPLRSGARQDGQVVAVACADRLAGAALVAHLVSDAVPGEVVVLARTARLLAEVSEACRQRAGGQPGVELATIHAAKGREWDRVILYGVDEGQTPHRQAVAAGEIEDERRLFYVALTRARLRLEIVCTQGRVSRFLGEAGVRPRRVERGFERGEPGGP